MYIELKLILYFIFKVPGTPEDWEVISREFYLMWNYPNCVGALDGKHILMQKPINSGSVYFNYKKTFSIVLLALVDANYRFIFIDIGCNGRISDGGVFSNSSLYDALDQDTLSLPEPTSLPGTDRMIPFHIVADEAFPLKTYLMKPYAQRGLTTEKRVFNYRLSRARRVVENAFGILSTRFRVFRAPLAVFPVTAEKIVMASCVLHNFLRSHTIISGCIDNDSQDDTDGMSSLVHQGSNHYSQDAAKIRDEICTYVNGPGRVDWQEKYA